jgi:hypothetical protein
VEQVVVQVLVEENLVLLQVLVKVLVEEELEQAEEAEAPS